MSIVRVGLAETKKFAQGYEAIFGKTPRATGGATSRSAPARGPKHKARNRSAKSKKK